MKTSLIPLMQLMQLTDSALPVGTFSFSNGLETAAHAGLVHDADTLESYVRSMTLQAAFTDGVAALHAHRAVRADDYEALLHADRTLFLNKPNSETRLMQQRMGRKLAELGIRLLPSGVMNRWLDDLRTGITPGTYPATQGILFARTGLSEEALFAALQYGTAGTVLNAALRCVKVSHYDTQQILSRLHAYAAGLYEEARRMTLEDMNAFAPQADILASMHEKGTMRMFMN